LLRIEEPGNGGAINVAPESNCGNNRYVHGTQVSLLASPNSGYFFSRWSADPSNNSSTAHLTTTQDKIVSAIFAEKSPYEQNVALNRPVSASAGVNHQMVVDGDPLTGWAARAFGPQWIEIDLQSPITLLRLQLRASQSPTGNTTHRIYVGGVDKVYSLIHEFNGVTSNNDELSYVLPSPMSQIRYIKVETVQSPSWVAWFEIAVFADMTPPATATPTPTLTATPTPTSTLTNTPVPPTSIPTNTPVTPDAPTHTPTPTFTHTPTATPIPVNDLTSSDSQLWTDPVVPRVGMPVDLRLQVERRGGESSWGDVSVRLYLGDLSTETVLGNVTIPVIGVSSVADTTPFAWVPPASGDYTIWASIDPDNALAESNESNNTVKRVLSVLPPAADTTPPTVTGLTINGNAGETIDRQISLETAAVDSESGLASVRYAELIWNMAANRWVVHQWSEWLPFGPDHNWTLSEKPGLRYVQVYVADQAGNISAAPAKAPINYIQTQDTLDGGEVRVYRRWVGAGQCLEVTLTPQSGDPDLYVWPPNYANGDTYWHSGNGGTMPDSVQVNAPKTGYYQIEVDAFTDTTYEFNVSVASTCTLQSASAPSVTAEKLLRTEPVVGVGSTPPGLGGEQPPGPPEIADRKIFLPAIAR